MDFVVQGRVYQYETNELIKNLLALDFCDRIIVSCWEDCANTDTSDKIKVVRSKPPEYAGDANRNLQIVSSLAGVRESSSTVCAKLRSDQIISVESLRLMNDFHIENHEGSIKGQSGAVCVAGIFRPFPFHPRDHIFWGPKEELVKIFDIPISRELHNGHREYSRISRAESYLGVHYAARFSEEAATFAGDAPEFLSDEAPRRAEAMKLSDILTAQLFKPFPRIQFSWPKHGLSSYHYHVTEKMGEYWNEELKWKR